eukprot:3478587-Pleurochrysis_carterae.AAC.1
MARVVRAAAPPALRRALVLDQLSFNRVEKSFALPCRWRAQLALKALSVASLRWGGTSDRSDRGPAVAAPRSK